MITNRAKVYTKQTLVVRPLEVLEVPENARAIGIAIGRLGWPRRKVTNRMQLRFEYFLDDGHEFRDEDGDVFSVDRDRLDGLFGDPGYKWLSDFPKRCVKAPLEQSPSLIVQKRLQLLDLGLRTPPLGFAI